MKLTKQNRKYLHLGFALEFILLSFFLVQQSKAQSHEETINRFCARVVGIPYASDNFTDEEWERFKYCKITLTR
jgi:hypothetical protein